MSRASPPIFPGGVTPITEVLNLAKQDGQVTYFSGQLPVFVIPRMTWRAPPDDHQPVLRRGGARRATSSGRAGVTLISVKRSVKIYREKEPEGFYARRAARGPAVLVDAVVWRPRPKSSGWRRRLPASREVAAELGGEVEHAAEDDPGGDPGEDSGRTTARRSGQGGSARSVKEGHTTGSHQLSGVPQRATAEAEIAARRLSSKSQRIVGGDRLARSMDTGRSRDAGRIGSKPGTAGRSIAKVCRA